MDRHFDDQGFNDSGLRTRPSELFQRNCWISFEPVEGSLNVLADYIGPNKILWATDYPHPDGFFPGAPAMIANRPSSQKRPSAVCWLVVQRRSTACSNLPPLARRRTQRQRLGCKASADTLTSAGARRARAPPAPYTAPSMR